MEAVLSDLPFPPPPGEDDLPSTDGVPVQSDDHLLQQRILWESLRRLYAGRSDVYVACELGLYYSELQAARREFLSPDIFVAFESNQRSRKSWLMWKEEVGPVFVLELLSESTEAVDRGEKMRIYSQILRVPEYFLYDPLDYRLEGYRLDLATRRYAPIPADASGSVPSGTLGAQFGVLDGDYFDRQHPWLRVYGSDGALIPLDLEVAAQESARAAQESARAEAATNELERLKEKLRALGVDP